MDTFTLICLFLPLAVSANSKFILLLTKLKRDVIGLAGPEINTLSGIANCTVDNV